MTVRPPLPPLAAHLAEAWAIYHERYVTFGAIMALGVAGLIGGMILAVGWIAGCLALSSVPAVTALGVLTGYALATVAVLGSLSWAAAALCHAISHGGGAEEAFRESRAGIVPMMSAHAAYMLTAGGASFLLLIPGAIFAVSFALHPFVATLEGLGGLDAQLRSRQYLEGRWLEAAWRLTAGWAMIGALQAVPVAGAIAGVALLPMPLILTYLLYRDLRASREPAAYQPSALVKGGVCAAAAAGWALGAVALAALFKKIMALAPSDTAAGLSSLMSLFGR